MALDAAGTRYPAAALSPAHRRLFAPPTRAAQFEFTTTADSIDRVAAFYRDRSRAASPQAWSMEARGALGLFDAAALFDRSRLARLYGGRLPRAARGPIFEGGQVTGAGLLVSPYPEADLKRLNHGTLIMIKWNSIPHGGTAHVP